MSWNAVIPPHNEPQEGDTLFGVKLNYRWRQIVVEAVSNYVLTRSNWEGSESEIDDAIAKAHELVADYYTFEPEGGNRLINFRRVILGANVDFDTSQLEVVLAQAEFTFTKKYNLITVDFLQRYVSGGTNQAATYRPYIAATGWEDSESAHYPQQVGTIGANFVSMRAIVLATFFDVETTLPVTANVQLRGQSLSNPGNAIFRIAGERSINFMIEQWD